MISKNPVPEWEDNIFWKLWKCDTLEELRLTAAVLGIDVERWLTNEGRMWWPRGMFCA